MYMQVKDLSIKYGTKMILKQIQMNLQKGEVASIIGPNGAGKTTLLKSMASIIPVERARIWIKDRDIRSYSANELAKTLGYVPQHTAFGYPLTVLETVLLGRKPYMQWNVTAHDLEVAGVIMERLQLAEMAQRYMDELSGGERQKVLIARALAQEPEILLLDEPTSALDIRHQLEVLELVRQLALQQQVLVVLIMHDLELAARYSDRVFLLQQGQIYASGRPEEVFTSANMEQVYGVKVEIGQGSSGLKLTATLPESR